MQKNRLLLKVMAIVFVSLASAAASDPVNDFKRALVEFYGPFGFHPFLIPEGHKVGDVVDIATLAVLRESEDCFPGLQPSAPVSVDIPRIKLLEDRAASFWVRLKSVFGVELNADETRQIHLNVEKASVISVSLGALRSSLSETCPELEPIFDNQLATVLGRRAVVVSSILNGSVNTIFSYSGTLDAEARLEDLARLLELPDEVELGVLAPEVAASLGLSDRLNLTSGDGEVRTIAYRPATIFRPRLGGNISMEFEPFDAKNPVHLERLQLLASAWAELSEDVE